MRLTIYLLVLSMAQMYAVSSFGQKTKLDIKMENTSVEEMLKRIESNSTYRFFYRSKDLDVNQKIDLDVKDKSVLEILDNVLPQMNLSYEVFDNYIAVKSASDLNGEQQYTIKGVVVDIDGNPLPGVNIVEKGTTNGAVTDLEGNYSISVSSTESILSFSYVGFLTEEIEIAGKTTVDITLIEDIQSLEEVVVVGYGNQKRINLTGAVASLKAEEFENRSITQASQALQGKMAGITITQNFGIPGNDAGTIRIRGIGSIMSGNDAKVNPLILIDGVEGSLNEINPRDIESVSVLKDAASSSIYGSRAANGVILVTTKRGNTNEKMSITYSGVFGSQFPTDLPEAVDGETYMMLKNENERNNGRPDLFTESYIQEYKANVGTEPYFNTDWYDAAMKSNAMQYQHNVTVRGGTEKIATMVSFSDLTQEALIDNTNFKRRTLRFNTDFKATNKLSFSFDGSLYTHKQVEPSRGAAHIFEMMAEIPAIYPAQWSDGTVGEGWNGDNPLGYINDGGSIEKTNNRILLNIKAKYEFTDWLSAEMRYAPKYLGTYRTTMKKHYTFRNIDGTEDTRPTGRNSLENFYNKTLENFYQALIRINKSFGDHTFSAILGYEALDNHYLNFQAARENLLLPDYEVLSGGDENYDSNSGGASEFALLSYLGRINYDFQNKYLLEANLRYDGSSRFASENRWGMFPSFSLGWRISEEDFMQNVETITNLKIRASWGKLGNQNIGNYPYQGLISINLPAKSVPYYFNKTTVSGGAQTVLANEDVSWETTEDMNLGIDFGLLNNRLSGSLDIYKRNTYDILYTRDIPAILGLEPAEQNIAEVENKGWDLQLYWRDKVGELGYGLDFVLSDVHNEVLDLAGKPQYDRNIIFEGEEYLAYYGYECIGIYRSQADLDKYPALNTNVTIGDLIFKDLNNDGIIDDTNDKTIIGSSIPRFNYGFTVNLDYKGIDFSMFLQGVGKKDLYYNVYSARYGGTYYAYQMNRLVPDDQSTWESADWPRINDGNTGSAVNQDNSFHIYNAAYLRCKNISLGYTIPEAITRKASLAGVRVYLTAQNLFTIDNLKIETIDPEAPDVQQYGTNYYPNTKTVAVGIDVKF